MRFVRPARFTACRGAKTNKRGRLPCVRSFRGKAQIHRVVSAEIAHGDRGSDASKSGGRDDVLTRAVFTRGSRQSPQSTTHFCAFCGLSDSGWVCLQFLDRV